VNVLVYSTLYPNPEQPHHGIFVERRVLELRARTGWRFEVVAPVPWFPLRSARFGRYARLARVPARDERHGITVHHPRYLVLPGLSWRIAPYFLLPGSLGLLRRIRRSGFAYDLIDAHFVFPDGVAATLAGERLGVPVLMTARGSDVHDTLRHALPRALLRRAIGAAAGTIAVADDLARELRELAGGRLEVPVLANGVDTTRFAPRDPGPIRDRLGLHGPVVLCVGNLRRLKGFHLVIEAVAGLEEVTLLIAGEGEEREALARLAAELGIAERIRLLGAIDNAALPDLYSAADVFVLASSSEGCPNVVLEAMACGTPVVATAVGAVRDLLPEKGHGLVVAERSAAALREGIETALTRPPCVEVYLRRARELSWDATCAALAGIMAGMTECTGEPK